ncbi:hypothetical protein PMAYCL1PPCAC_14629, partial [Pristionchus mayeri]
SSSGSTTMRRALGVAVLAVLACAASGAFRGQFADLFNTWSPSEGVHYVKDFDHYAETYHPEVYKEEHTRKKRNAEKAALFMGGNPITKACDRPGYTGQYCEFPICQEFNPFANPEQFLGDDGYIVDLTDLGNCTNKHELIVDETMVDIRIEVQSLENVSPQLTIYDAQGYIGTPDRIEKGDDRFIAYFAFLKAGYYTLQPSASSLNSRCILQTTAQTFLTISGGFQTDDRDRNDFPNENAAAHQFNSIMVHLNGGRSPAELKTISVIGPENQVFRPRILDKRYGCQYEYYFDSLFCSKTGTYAMIVEGVDFYGLPFRRAGPFQCAYKAQPSTSPGPVTTPAPTNPSTCANAGVLLESGGKSSCICQDHWTGYDCSQPLCVNGGTLIAGKCFCTSGFEGDHCEIVKCEPNSNHGFGVDKPTLVFAVRVRSEMNDVMKQVQMAVDQVVENLQFDPSYLTRFTVVYFNEYTNFAVKHYTSIRDFDNDFQSKATNSANDLGGCTDSVLGAVATALTNLQMTQGSTVYVITDALADDQDTDMEAILQLNSYWRATINFLYVEPTAESGCISDLSDPGFRVFDEVANRFGGLAWHVDARNKVYDALYGHMNSIIYKSQLMLTVDRDECYNGLNKVIQMEKNSDSLVFIAKGRDFELEVIAPDGTPLTRDAIVDQDLFTIQRTNDPIAGTYMVRFYTKTPTASCNVRAYQASYQSYSNYQPVEAFWGISTDVDVDAVLYQPVVGMDNHPVFHIENYGDSEDYDHAFAFLNMYAVRGGVEQEVYAANGMFRGGCSFHFYFPSFRCRPNENMHYEFNVRTEEGFYIQRAGVMTCFNYIPTPIPPSDCQNGGVKVNGTCLCMPHYEGDKCQTVNCANGGTPFFGICSCSPGWTGPFCMTPTCSESGPVPNYGFQVDMAFIVEVTKNGVEQIKQLITSLPEIIRDVKSQHPDWIDRLVLIGYDSDKVVGMVDAPIDNTDKFFDTLNKWGNLNPTDDGCIVKIWPAIDQLLNGRMDGPNQRVLPDRSVVNIFETGQPSDMANTVNLLSVSEEFLERKTLTNVFQMRDPTTGGWRCNGNNDDFQYIEQLARRGDGKMYTIDNGDIPKAVRMIPTLFQSAIVYKYHTDDCSVGHNVFFPVDAYTQTVTAIVAGYQAVVHLNRYDSTPFTADGRIDILNDNMNQVIEFRNPCDSDWDSISQYCMYFNSALVKNWVAGNTECQGMGGFLADDLSQDKNDWLKNAMAGQKAWLGLTYTNNKWVFQHDDGQQIAVPNTVNYWNDGKIPDGTTGTCAYFYNGWWYAAQCDEKHLVVCQKHMFDSSNEPSDLGDDDLSPGKYFLFVQTAQEGGSWRGCDVEVRVQSDLNIEFGFVDDLRKDTPHPVANIDSDQNRVVASIAIGKEETQTSFFQHVQLRSDDASSLLLEAATFSYRFGCENDYVSQPLSCEQTNGSDFSVVLIGVDDTGNTFQRYSTSLCYKWYVCFNGGVYSNGACLCPDYFTGEDCRTPMCQNGGTPATHGNKCNCMAGFGGDACQYVQCDANSGATFSNDDKALIIVVEKSDNNADAIQSLADKFAAINKDVNDQHPNWFKYFLLETFTIDGKIDQLALYNDADDLAAHLAQVATEAKGVMGACQAPIWDALTALFAKPDLGKYLSGAEVLLVSAAAPLDADLNAIHTTMEMFDTHTPIIDYIHVETTQCQVDDWAKGLGTFAQFLSTTGGMVFRVDPKTSGDAIDKFLPTRYAAQRLSYADALNCQTNEIFVQVDQGIKEYGQVYISVGGKGATISVEDPQQQVQFSTQLWQSDYQSFWSFKATYPGIYKVTVNSQSRSCFPVVYGNGGAQVIFGYIQDYNTGDAPKPYPVYGSVNFPVFYQLDYLTNTASTNQLYMAHMERQSIGGDYETPYDSDIDLRVGCSYNYIGKGFTCLQENDVITMSASGMDAYNQPFTRQSTAYCKKDGYYTTSTKSSPKSTSPTPTVPTTTALTPATINLDVLFIIDETEDEDFIRNTAEPFIEKTVSIYTTNQRFTRVGLITMPNKETKSMPVAFLSSIDSYDALDQNLISLEDFAINSTDTNEYLTQALQFANDPNKYRKEEHGYRNGISNHLIVVLTAKNKLTDKDKAIVELQKIASGQTYGVIAVGFGTQADWSDLNDLAGSDCVSIAASQDALLGQTTSFIQNKIWDAAFNGGRYCAPANIAMANINH